MAARSLAGRPFAPGTVSTGPSVAASAPPDHPFGSPLAAGGALGASVVYRRLLSVSFVAGPALLVASALTYALGIGLVPPGLTSWVEGILGSYALLFFVPIYVELARRLGETHPRLGTAAIFLGLAGAVTGFSMELHRVVEFTLRNLGAGDAVWEAFYANPGAEYLSVALMGPLFPLTSIVLGVGFWRARTLPRWIAACLVAAGVGFPLAQVVGWDVALKVTYPGACALWLVALLAVRARLFPRRAAAAGGRGLTVPAASTGSTC